MKIGKFDFPVPVFLAPMAGVTDTPYRILAREMGCPLVYSEMVSDKGINYRNEHTLRMLSSEENERPIAMQLFGAEPDSVARAAAYIEELKCADIIDFNMGCPAPKVVKNHEGSALLRNPEGAFKVLKALVGAVSLPVTVKMRIGWDDAHINVLEMARLAEEAGVQAVAVHGRTREQFYSGRANWSIIGDVRKQLRIPVIANGDIRNVDDLIKIREVTGCEAVMVGRAAQGNPWIFRQLTHYLKTGERLPAPTMEERKTVILRHLDMLLRFKGDYIGPREMRKHATWYTRGIKGNAELRVLFNKAETREDFINILNKMK
ncbi:MAG: tRNA dihydrouridine synthase DusB [Anaerovibrio sp.]|uniref:tRNA dihydrouridine synthase DusB n=1 Tax=Anaerovibrio sp. TaxID=1872532 RepID=UPI0025DA75FF|nr:tRNA dihydrouridine synthase DusB [Anaerovibrio sp.]MCR5176593.1 tRNA dihydrouridine synthase DusB [Anaerovibrio sp.]